MRASHERTGRRIQPDPSGAVLPVLLTAGLLVVAVGGCGDAVGPESARVGDLEVELTLSADDVRLQQSFTARVVLRNTGDEDVTLVSPCTALAFVGLHRAAERLRVEGTERACFAAETHWEIPAGGELSHTWTVTAETPEGDPIARGLYLFRLDFEVDLPSLETRVRVS